jgi:dihydroorotase
VELVRAAKREGLAITADVSINSLHLSDVDIGYFDASLRLTPPLRQGRDRAALRAGLADGTLDALVSDHTPVTADEKNLPFAEATPGATGLELLLSLALRWAEDEGLPLPKALAVITAGPVGVLGTTLGSLADSAGRLVAGGVADVCVFDAKASWSVTPERLVSQGKHTPFAYAITGFELPAQVRYTLVAGHLAYEKS